MGVRNRNVTPCRYNHREYELHTSRWKPHHCGVLGLMYTSWLPKLASCMGAVPGSSTATHAASIINPFGKGKSLHVPLQALTLGLWMQWPGGPVDLKTYWPPQKLTGPPKTNWPLPQNQSCAMKKYLRKRTI